MRNALFAVSVVTLAAMSVPVAASPSDDAMQEYERALNMTPNLESGKKIYRTCAVCHTPEGWGLELSLIHI